MTEDLVEYGCSVQGRLWLSSFWGGKKGRCVQLTMKTDYVQMTFEEAKQYFKRCIEAIEKQEIKLNADPPWWERIAQTP